jgi:ElaB/YqjD/DUF883 family membrane-anchored ribosome-binding protein
MIYGYARVSTDGQSLDAQVKQLSAAGAEKVLRETASGAKTDRVQLRRALDQLDKGDVLTVTRLDRLARSTRDLLNTVATITSKGAGFRSLHDTWADTTTAHGRLMLTVLGGLAEFERELIRPHRRGPRHFYRSLSNPVPLRARTHEVLKTSAEISGRRLPDRHGKRRGQGFMRKRPLTALASPHGTLGALG